MDTNKRFPFMANDLWINGETRFPEIGIVHDEEDVFRLTVPINGAYSVETLTTRKTTRKGPNRPATTEEVVDRIRRVITENPVILLEDLAVQLGMTKDGVYYHIRQLLTQRAQRNTKIRGIRYGNIRCEF